MNNIKLQLKNEVMNRVKTVSFIRMFVSSPYSGAVFVAAVLSWLTIIVSFQHVVKNAMAHERWTDSVSYIFSSFIHTRTLVQVLAVLMCVGCGIAGFNLLRTLKKSGILNRIPLIRRAI